MPQLCMPVVILFEDADGDGHGDNGNAVRAAHVHNGDTDGDW